MWFYKDKVKKPNVTHTDCPSCEYLKECLWVLRYWHRITGRCSQGRKAPVRIKAKTQITLDEVKASEGVTDATGILTPQS